MLSTVYDRMGGEKLTRSNEKGTFSAYRFTELGNVNSGAVPTVVCLHGFPDNIFTFRHQIPLLTKAGFQVVVPVMRGYETGSVQSEQQYFLNQIAQDIVDWMDCLSIHQAHIVGHDWGAVTAWVMAGLAPQRICSLTSVAIPPLGRFQQVLPRVPSQLLYSWYIGFFQLGKIADWAVELNDWQFIRFLWKKWSPNWDADEHTLTSVVNTLSAPGVKQATLGYYRCLTSVRHSDWLISQKLLNKKIEVPVQLIYGVDDGCMNQRIFDAAIVKSDFKAGLVVQAVEGAGHFVQLEKPQLVGDLLVSFFTRDR